MAKRKKGIDEKIIASAKTEFLREGYFGASLRKIAAGAGTSTGAIYARYERKEELLSAVIEPTASEFMERVREWFSTAQNICSEEFQYDFWLGQIDFLYEYKDEFLLLLTAPRYTKYGRYEITLAEIAAKPTYEHYSERLKKKEIEPYFVVAIYLSLFSGIFEMVLRHTTKQDAVKYVPRLCRYFRVGWQSILQ